MSAKMLGVELKSGLRAVARWPSAYMHSLYADAAAHEYRTLEAVHRAGLPGPQPFELGDSPDGRFLLMEWLPGTATARTDDVDSYVSQVADALLAIHRSDPSTFDFLLETRRQSDPNWEGLAADLREPEVVAALQQLGGPPPAASVLRHGDFWPGNLLWEDGRLTGIVDWENALLGPAAADVAITRLDLSWAFGRDAMEAFTLRYQAQNPIADDELVYWDLRAARRPMSNLSEWDAPYTALNRPDVTADHLRAVLLEFVDDVLQRWAAGA